MGSHRQALPAVRLIKSKEVSNPGVNAIGSNDERGSLLFPIYPQADDSLFLQKGRLYDRSGMRANTWRGRRCVEENRVKVFPSLCTSSLWQSSSLGEVNFGSLTTEVIANAVEGCASNRFRQAKPLKNRHACGHQTFPARLFPRKMRALEKFNRETATTQNHRKD